MRERASVVQQTGSCSWFLTLCCTQQRCQKQAFLGSYVHPRGCVSVMHRHEGVDVGKQRQGVEIKSSLNSQTCQAVASQKQVYNKLSFSYSSKLILESSI